MSIVLIEKSCVSAEINGKPDFTHPKNAIFDSRLWGIFKNDAAPQKTNKDRTNTILPPSFRQVLQGLAENIVRHF
jgi:hypothetical protein